MTNRRAPTTSPHHGLTGGLSVMSRLAAKISARLLLVVLVFVPSLLAVSFVGVRGLRSAASSADVLYTDNLATIAVTQDVSRVFGAVVSSTNSYLVATDANQVAALRNRILDEELPALDVALDHLRDIHVEDEGDELATVEELIGALQQFRREWVVGRVLDGGGRTSLDLVALDGELQALRSRIDAMSEREHDEAALAYDDAISEYDDDRNIILLISAVALALGVTAVLVIARRVVPAALAQEEHQAEFAEIMQVAEDEGDVHDLLKRHLERTVPHGTAVIFNRNNSVDRLEAVTAIAEDSPLRDGLDGAGPRACLAVRTGRVHAYDAQRPPLLSCAVCGGCEGASLCTPLTVGGEVIGSVLVNSGEPIGPDEERRIRESVTTAAPVLANLRNLAVAEFRAATDGLTGLPNQRAAKDTLKRMVAQASRNVSPLAALLVDLDHFKQVNDQFGHGAGDDVLAAVGVVLSEAIRANDFAGRLGGEEFLLLLPDTGIEGAVQVADKIRSGVAEIFVPQIERRISASVGVAVLPDHAGDGDALLRAADRALYVAKGNGRDRTEVAVASAGPAPVDPVTAR